MCKVTDQDGNVIDIKRILQLIEALEILPNDTYLYKNQDGHWNLLDDDQRQISLGTTLENCLVEAGYIEAKK